MVTRHVWQDAPDEVTAFTKAPKGRGLYAWRKETIERSFADAKENHGLRFARMLGLANMREQSFLTAAVQNMKGWSGPSSSRFSLLTVLIQTATLRTSRKVAVLLMVRSIPATGCLLFIHPFEESRGIPLAGVRRLSRQAQTLDFV